MMKESCTQVDKLVFILSKCPFLCYVLFIIMHHDMPSIMLK
jgi:hypothetical protein